MSKKANIDSRFFELLTVINPAAPNQVTFTLARTDSNTKTIRLEGQAANGYVAADVLKKTPEHHLATKTVIQQRLYRSH